MDITPEIKSEMSGDHPNAYINLTMPAISRREYSGPSFKADEQDWDAVQILAAQFRAETGQGANPGEYGESGDVWLVESVNSPRATYCLAAGAANIVPARDEWVLTWWWIHPNERSNGLALRLWKDLESKYGNFCLEDPISSKAMEGFLSKHDPDGHHKLVVWQ